MGPQAHRPPLARIQGERCVGVAALLRSKRQVGPITAQMTMVLPYDGVLGQ